MNCKTVTRVKIERVTVSTTLCTATSKVRLPDVYLAHNTLLNLCKYLTMCYIYIAMLRYLFPEQFQSLRFAKWNIHRKLLKQPLNSFIVPSIDLLKLWEFLYTLTVWTYMMMHFYFEKKQYVSLALRNGHLRVEGISFYIQIPRRF